MSVMDMRKVTQFWVLCRYEAMGTFDTEDVSSSYGVQSDEAVGVNSQGRVTLPKAVRDAAGIEPGTILYIHTDRSGELVLETRQARIRRIRALAAPTDGSTAAQSDELIAERRAEAAREDAA